MLQKNPPYSLDEIKSINTFQLLSDFTKDTCKCGGLHYATEQGLICKACNNLVESVPIFMTNWAWRKFRKLQAEAPETE